MPGQAQGGQPFCALFSFMTSSQSSKGLVTVSACRSGSVAAAAPSSWAARRYVDHAPRTSAHTILLANDGTSVSSGYFDTSITPEAVGDELTHAKAAHVAERYRLAGRLFCSQNPFLVVDRPADK